MSGLVYVIPLTYRPTVSRPRYGPGVSDWPASLLLVAVAWLLVISAALLVLRAVVAEDLSGEQDHGDDQVSGHVPSESRPVGGNAPDTTDAGDTSRRPRES